MLARNGIPIAKIFKYEPPKIKPLGAWKGKVAYSEDWNSPATNAAIERLFLNPEDDATPYLTERCGRSDYAA